MASDSERGVNFREMAEELVLMSRRQRVGAVLLKTCIEDKLRAAYSHGLDVGNETLKVNFKHWTDLARREGYREALEQAEEIAKDWWRKRRSNPEELFDSIRHLASKDHGEVVK